MGDLKRCPFCGQKPRATSYITEAAVRCSGCGATITRTHPPLTEDGYPRAIAAWNRRTPEPGKDWNNG